MVGAAEGQVEANAQISAVQGITELEVVECNLIDRSERGVFRLEYALTFMNIAVTMARGS